jgi:TRAP-type C4-dicarboxylate transport system permease large subunit
MNVFVVKSVIPDARLRDIFAGVVPFIFALLLGLVLLFMMPSIATFLPKLMG